MGIGLGGKGETNLDDGGDGEEGNVGELHVDGVVDWVKRKA